MFCCLIQLIDDSKTGVVEKYKALYKKTNEIMNEHFGGLMENKDVQDLHEAILDLYQQVRLYWIMVFP